MIRGGAGSDQITGDNVFEADGGGTDTLLGDGGPDLFAYFSAGGRDTIADFTPGSDLILIASVAPISFGTFDSNGNEVLDNADDYVAVSGGTTVIDIGDAESGTQGANARIDTLTVTGVTGLSRNEIDFF